LTKQLFGYQTLVAVAVPELAPGFLFSEEAKNFGSIQEWAFPEGAVCPWPIVDRVALEL